MALLGEVNDLNYRILFLLDPKSILRLILLNRRSCELVTNISIYQDLLQLRNVSLKYKFGSKEIVEQYYQYGLVEILKQYGYYCTRGIYLAARYGHVSVLNWMIKSDLIPSYTTDAVDRAAAHGHVTVLEWFYQCGLEFKYTTNAIDWQLETAMLLCWIGFTIVV